LKFVSLLAKNATDDGMVKNHGLRGTTFFRGKLPHKSWGPIWERGVMGVMERAPSRVEGQSRWFGERGETL